MVLISNFQDDGIPGDYMFDEEEDDCAATMTPREIYEKLLETEELILTIPADEEIRLRQGLATAKAKMNKRLEADGMPIDRKVLSFHKSQNRDNPTAIDLHIILSNKGGVKIYGMKLPDTEL